MVVGLVVRRSDSSCPRVVIAADVGSSVPPPLRALGACSPKRWSRTTVASEVLDPWAPRAQGRDTTVHRVPIAELGSWADAPRRTRRAAVIYPIVSPEVIDPWRAPEPEPSTAGLDPVAGERRPSGAPRR
ncbi:MAG: hypothetical protein R3B99_04415 [Polyangiales bacterium]